MLRNFKGLVQKLGMNQFVSLNVTPMVAITVAAAFWANPALAARSGDQNLGWPGKTLAANECYGPKQGFGPYDYNDPAQRQRSDPRYKSNIELVENRHFTAKVESLRGGETSIDSYGDTSYTINAFPNHHRALWAMTRYYLARLHQAGEESLLTMERLGQEPVPPECWFNRAIYFAPEDPIAKMLFATYLHRRGQFELALDYYQQAERLLPNHAELAYNLGLLFVDEGDLDNAKRYAVKARDLGYPLKGLKKRISEKERDLRKTPE